MAGGFQTALQPSDAGDLWTDGERAWVRDDVVVAHREAVCTGEPFRYSSLALTSPRIPLK